MDFNEPDNQLNANLIDENLSHYPSKMPTPENYGINKSYIVELTTKKAVELLLEGTLRSKVCRYCLHVASPLSDLDQILQIAGKETMYKVTIRDMVASFHPFQVPNDPNFPKKICNKCLDRTISSYLFTQQCEQSERALRNCFDDMYEKLEKLDPLERTNKRGRQKKNPNHNVLFTEHQNVIDYAEPIRNLVNVKSVMLSQEPFMSELECPKCWQIFTKIEDLIVHEKTHPNSMWFSCRLCGKSFVRRIQLRRHLKQLHAGIETSPDQTLSFQCGACDFSAEDHSVFFQHLEKHRFHTVLEHLLEKKVDKLCVVCLDTKPKLVALDNMVRLHGGYPGLSGDKTVYSILGFTLPEMNTSANYTGTKICENCLNNAITSYVFINHSIYTRDRLNTCISSMLDALNKLDNPTGNVFIEITKESILPLKEQDYFDENLLLEEDEIDETKLKVDVLEDEFRKPDSDESESEPEIKDYINTFLREESRDSDEFNVKREKEFVEIDNPAKRVTKTYTNRRLVNGYQTKAPSDNEGYNSLDDVSEFLTFKKKKKPSKRYYKYTFTCPLCSKKFVTDFHLLRHVLKHVNKKVDCYICSRQFRTKFALQEHVKMAHVMRKRHYLCNICGRAFENEDRLRTHENSHLAKQCQLCDKFFISQKHFDNHMQRHAGKLKHIKHGIQICSFCEKDFSNDNQLSLHVNKVHLQIKPYSCDMCEMQFYTDKNLNKHKKIHNLKSKESCELCKKRFNNRKSMVIHLRKHTGETPHRCPLCGRSFYSENKAKNHMRHYHGGTLYCKLCKSVFSCKYDLKAHVIMLHNHNTLL